MGLRVSLFITCYNDTLFPETGKAVVRVLERLGHTVDFPAGQTCCGQMHWNTGYQAEAMPLLQRFVEQFKGSEAVVVPVDELRGDDARPLSDDGGAVEGREAEGGGGGAAAEGVGVLGVSDEEAGAGGCGGLLSASGDVSRELPWTAEPGLGDGPMRLLRAVRGIDLVEIENLEHAAGLAGRLR